MCEPFSSHKGDNNNITKLTVMQNNIFVFVFHNDNDNDAPVLWSTIDKYMLNP